MVLFTLALLLLERAIECQASLALPLELFVEILADWLRRVRPLAPWAVFHLPAALSSRLVNFLAELVPQIFNLRFVALGLCLVVLLHPLDHLVSVAVLPVFAF